MAAGNISTDLKFEELMSYSDVLQKLSRDKKRAKHLIMGNGFSMAYDSKIFSYNALYNFIEELNDPVLTKLFKIIDNKNFELVMQQIDNFIEIAKAFGADEELLIKLKAANQKLQTSLIEAISSLHPEHVFKIPEEKSKSCAKFLNEFLLNNGKVFTTNYDLLMYWVLMRNEATKGNDGFGREMLNPEKVIQKQEEPDWSDLFWGESDEEQTIFFVHGSLPLFDTGTQILKEVYDTEHYLLDNIKKRTENKDYPVFVTAGNGDEKLNHIRHNPYLNFCYNQLSSLEGSLISFGFNFGEYDEHIIDAINKAANNGFTPRDGKRLWSIYIGVYSEDGLEHIKVIQAKFLCKVNVYNARSANIWGV